MDDSEIKKIDIIYKSSLLLGSFYFLLVTIAHSFELKLPGLFIYYDVKSTTYQNKIIAMMTSGWVFLFYLGKVLLDIKQYKYLIMHILLGGYSLVMLVSINLHTEIKTLNETGAVGKYWIPTILLFFYWIWLVALYIIKLNTVKKTLPPANS